MKKTSCLAGIALLPAAGGFALGFEYGPKILGALLVLAAWAAAAQPDGPPPDGGGGPHHHPPRALILKALDANGDGIIDANEIANAPAALKALDKNGDGQLTLDEFIGPWAKGSNAPPNGRRPMHRPPPLPLVMALDVNSNGVIDADEIANASAELLKLDKNGDGKLTPDEFLPPRPGLAGGPPGFDGPPPGDGPPDFDGPPPGDGPPDGNGPPDGPPPGDEPPDGDGPPPPPQ